MKKREFRLLCLNNNPILCHNSLITNIKKINEFKYSALFQSHFSKKLEEVNICFSNFRYEPIFGKPINYFNKTTLMLLIENAAKKAAKFSKENFVFPDEQLKEDILKLIERAINKSMYCSNDEFNIFNLTSEVFFNLLVSSHKLKNGNKRMATSLLIILLESFGYYFKFSNANEFIKDKERNQYWESEVVYFIEMRNKQHKDDETIKKEIYNWIKNNSYILIRLY